MCPPGRNIMTGRQGTVCTDSVRSDLAGLLRAVAVFTVPTRSSVEPGGSDAGIRLGVSCFILLWCEPLRWVSVVWLESDPVLEVVCCMYVGAEGPRVMRLVVVIRVDAVS